jgi:hypothetical protein
VWIEAMLLAAALNWASELELICQRPLDITRNLLMATAAGMNAIGWFRGNSERTRPLLCLASRRNIGSQADELGLASDWLRLGQFNYVKLWYLVPPMPAETSVQVSANE